MQLRAKATRKTINEVKLLGEYEVSIRISLKQKVFVMIAPLTKKNEKLIESFIEWCEEKKPIKYVQILEKGKFNIEAEMGKLTRFQILKSKERNIFRVEGIIKKLRGLNEACISS